MNSNVQMNIGLPSIGGLFFELCLVKDAHSNRNCLRNSAGNLPREASCQNMSAGLCDE